MRSRRTLLLLFLCVLLGPATLAESAAAPARPPDAAPPPQDLLGRTTPRGTVLGFIRAAQAGDNERAADYLDTRHMSYPATQLAQDLKVILDRGLRINLDFLSTKPEGEPDDPSRPERNLVGVVTAKGRSLDISLERVQRGASPPIWLFAGDTLRRVPDMAAEIGPPWIETHIPKPFLEIRFLSFSLWQWMTIFLVIPISLLLAGAVNRLLIPALRPAIRYLTREQDDRQLARIAGPVRLLIVVVMAHLSMVLLALPVLAFQYWARVASTLAIIGAAWLLIRLNHIVADLTDRHLGITGRAASTAVVHLVQRLITATTVLAAALVFLYMIGVDLTAALAGLGVGGIAVAFAAQKTLENLFGGIMLTSDQPIRVGDFCRFGDQLGTVEDIGLRSTRIRTPDRTVASVPNGQVAAMSLENFGLRDKLWFHPTLQLRHDTSPDQLRYVLAELRQILYAHPKVETDSARVRFVGFGTSSLSLEVFAYVQTIDYAAFLEIQEDLLLRMMDTIEKSGTSLALPSHLAYVARDHGRDTEKTQAVMAEVAHWRAHKELPFPNFTPSRIAEMRGTIDYPPPESAVHPGRS